MEFFKREGKPQEKVKVAKASVPFYAVDMSMMCFKCSELGHMWKECKVGKSDFPQSGGYYSRCSAKWHKEAKYWKLYPYLKPVV